MNNDQTMLVLVARDSGQFSPGDVEWANTVFDRDGVDAWVYEFDPVEKKFKALTRESLNARARKN